MGRKPQLIGLAAVAIGLMLFAGIQLSGWPDTVEPATPGPADIANAATTRRMNNDPATRASYASATHRADPSAARTTIPTDVDRQKLDSARWVARGRDPLLNPDLVRIFDQLTGRAGTPQLALGEHVPPEHLAQAQRLLEKYRQYRQDLAGSAAPETGRPPSELLDAVLTTRLNLQRKHFSDAEIAGLFAEDNQYDRFTIERLRTGERTDLTIEQKEETVARLTHSLLTPEQREARDTARLPARIAGQNAWFDKTQTTAQQRMDTRSAEFGTEAAARMAEVDRQETEWQQRIARLAAADPASQQPMRATLFTPQEQLRIDGALALQRTRQGTAVTRSAVTTP